MKTMHVHIHGALDDEPRTAPTADDWAKWNAEHKTSHGNVDHHMSRSDFHDRKVQEHGSESAAGKRHKAAALAHAKAAGALHRAAVHHAARGATDEYKQHMERAKGHGDEAHRHEQAIDKHDKSKDKEPAADPKKKHSRGNSTHHGHVKLGQFAAAFRKGKQLYREGERAGKASDAAVADCTCGGKH